MLIASYFVKKHLFPVMVKYSYNYHMFFHQNRVSEDHRDCNCKQHWCLQLNSHRSSLPQHMDQLQVKIKMSFLDKLIFLKPLISYFLLCYKNTVQPHNTDIFVTSKRCYYSGILSLFLTWRISHLRYRFQYDYDYNKSCKMKNKAKLIIRIFHIFFSEITRQR